MNSPANRREFLASSALALGTLAAAPGAFGRRRPSRPRPEGLVAFRISNEQWFPEHRFRELLDFFRACPGTADELAFFTSSTHPPLPLDELRRRAECLATRLPQVRELGLRAGINLLATMGHHEENLDGSLAEAWPRVTDPHGRVSRGSFCPASAPFRGYVVEVYRALTAARPDFIWIDDDVRLAGHMPVGQTCFCDGCVDRFSSEAAKPLTRESLLALFESGSIQERMGWRRRWLEHNRATIRDLFRLIEATVHEVQPGLPLGFMTGDRFYEGYDFARWADALAGPGRSPVRWRPGGGFYSDETLVGMIGKAHDVGRQVAQLPPAVEVIQSEIENFPYDLLRKAAETTVVEAAAHMAAGCTGTAFNVLSQRPDPLEEYEPLLRRIQAARPFYQQLREDLGRLPVVGVWPAWNRDAYVANNLEGSWPDGPNDAIAGFGRAYVLGEIGIPLCYAAAGARVTALAGPALLTFDAEQLRRIFAGGVLMDLAAWQALDRLGLTRWTGVKPGVLRPRDAIEVLTEHPLNGRFAGRSRDCRQSFWREPAQTLEPTATNVEVLARMIDYLDRDLGPSMTAHTNELGGRVVVMGYFPWTQLHHQGKSSQMKAVCAWLAGGRLPMTVDSFHRLHVWVRERPDQALAGVVLNGSLDPARSAVLRVPASVQSARWTDLAGNTRRLRSRPDPTSAAGAPTRLLPLPHLAAWSVALVTTTV